MFLKKILGNLPVTVIHGDLKKDITGINYNSKKIEKGNMFVCIKGFKNDGHEFIHEAITSGASCIIIEREIPQKKFTNDDITIIKVEDTRKALPILASNFFEHPANKINLIGVTGTNGKTTTTFLIEAILKEHGEKTGLMGTIENRIGHICFSATHTTPESLELQQIFNVMEAEKVTYGIMEVSSHALHLGRVDQVEFDVAVFTNLTQDHLDYHPDMDEYYQAKSILFKNLGATSYKNRSKYGVINGDDPYGKKLATLCQGEVVSYGIKQSNDIYATDVRIKATGVIFTVNYWKEPFHLSLKLTGLFSVYNALAATAVCLLEGVEPATIKNALEKLTGVAGRFESVDEGQEFSIIVDYAHTPDGLENVLLTAKEFAQRKIITVFGCGGDRDKAKRPLMGEKAAQHSSYCIITSDNPRTEEPNSIIQDILPGVLKYMGNNQYQIVEDRALAIHTAIEMAHAGDIILIAGKGHETYQIIKDEVIQFDDRLVAREALRKRGYHGS